MRYRPVARYAVAGAFAVLALSAVGALGVPYLSAGFASCARWSAALLAVAVLVMLAVRASPRVAGGRWAVDAWLVARSAAQTAATYGGPVVLMSVLLTMDPVTTRPGDWNPFAVVVTGGVVLVAAWWFAMGAGFPIMRWERSRALLAKSLRDEQGPGVVVEVRLGFLGSMRRTAAVRILDGIAGPRGAPARDVHAAGRLAMETAMLRACPVGREARGRLRGVVVHASATELERVHPGEVEIVAEWLRDVYRHTWAPVWMVGDWVGRVESRSPALARSRRSLASVGPLLSGAEYFSSLVHYSVLDQTPETIVDTLRHNQRMRVELLEEFGLAALLSEACTPVAATARAVFGAPELSERIRLLMEMLERGIAFFALALSAEATATGVAKEHHKLRGALERNLDRPTLADWISLLNAFRRHGTTPLCTEIRAWLDAPYPAGNEVRRLWNALAPAREKTVQGEGDGNSVTRRQVLELAREARNHLSAHGSPADEVEVYKNVLRVTIRLAASLPWHAVVLSAPGARGGRIVFRGCLSATGPGEPLTEPMLVVEGDGSVPARPFLDVDAGGAVLMYAGRGRMLEVVSGTYVQAATHG